MDSSETSISNQGGAIDYSDCKTPPKVWFNRLTDIVI